MDSRPIGVYDSGVGGLTGLRALMRLLPGEDFVYFSDSGRMISPSTVTISFVSST